MTQKTILTSSSTTSLAEARATTDAGWLATRWREWRVPILIFVGWRLWFVPVSLWAGATLPHDLREDIPLFVPPRLDNLTERLLGVWGHWDGEWFMYLVQVGYRPGDQSAPFFPLYPALVKLVSLPLGGNFILAGPLVSNFFGLTTFIGLYELAKFEFQKTTATRTILMFAAYPTAFFVVACYSEGLFLSLTIGAFLVARKYANWPLVGLLIGLAALSRNMGILLLLPLGWEWWRQHLTLSEADKFAGFGFGKVWVFLKIKWAALFAWPTLVFIAVPVGLFSFWIAFNGIVLGKPFGFVGETTRPGWDRRTMWLWQTLGYVLELFGRDRPRGIQDPHFFDLAFWVFSTVLWLAAIYLTWRRQLPIPYLIYFTIALALPLSGINPSEPLNSFPRYSLLAFPAFMIMGRARGSWRLLTTLYLIIAALLLTFMFARFANWYWIA